MPGSRPLSLAGRNVPVIDRFDRTRDGDRIGYLSAMTMLEASDGERRRYLGDRRGFATMEPAFAGLAEVGDI